MHNLEILTYETATEEGKRVFDFMKGKIGRVPNIYAVAAHSPNTLTAYLEFNHKLRKSEFNPKEIEMIALVIAQENGCEYCLASHTQLALGRGFKIEDTIEIRSGRSNDSKLQALINLTRSIVASRGKPEQKLIDVFFEVGYSKGALVTLIGFISANIFTNYLHEISDVQIDFPNAPDL